MKELNKNIKENKIQPVYLFYGAERFLLQQTVELLTAQVAPGDNPFNLERINCETASVNEVIASANTLPFFAERKLIIADNCPWFANQKKSKTQEENVDDTASEPDLEALHTYLTNPAETTVLVFIAGESVNKVRRVYKAAAKSGVVQEFAVLKGNSAVLWLDEQLRRCGKQISAAAKQQLLLYCDYNCTLVNNELAKLCAYTYGRDEIVLDDIEEIVSSNQTASIFNLTDHVVAGDLSRALRALEQVVLNDAPESIIPRLSDHFQTLYIVKQMQKQGHNTREMLAATGKSHPFVIEKAGRQAAKYSDMQLQKALETLLTADRKFKTGVSDIMNAIEAAIIQICLMTSAKRLN